MILYHLVSVSNSYEIPAIPYSFNSEVTFFIAQSLSLACASVAFLCYHCFCTDGIKLYFYFSVNIF